MKKYFISFADKKLVRSLNRIIFQAKSLNFFDSCHGFNEDDISFELKDKIGYKLNSKFRGFGYWAWKPDIILRFLEKIEEGSGLIYVDAGCHINPGGLERLQQYFDILNKSETGIVAFQAVKPNHLNSIIEYDGRDLFDQPNYRWIKGDIFDYFGVRDLEAYTNSQAIGAGIILVKKNKQSLSLINEWRDIALNNFSLFDDSPSLSCNLPGFIENRHDQAVFTILCLKYKVTLLSAYEYWYPSAAPNNKKKADWRQLKSLPIHARRDKDFGLIINIINYIKIINKKIRS